MATDEGLKAAFFLESERPRVAEIASIGIGRSGQVLKVAVVTDDGRRVLSRHSNPC